MMKKISIILVGLFLMVGYFLSTDSANPPDRKNVSNTEEVILTLRKVTKPIHIDGKSNYNPELIPKKCKETFAKLEEQIFYKELNQNDIETSFECLKKHLLGDSINHVKYLESSCSQNTVKFFPSACMGALS